MFRQIFHRNKLNKFNYCPICGRESIFKDFGKPVRKNVYCPNCGSLERHRFLYFVYKIIFLGNIKEFDLLHMSPEQCLSDLIREKGNIKYFCSDLNPSNFNYITCEKQDFTNMSYKDKAFDVILLNQVLEHIKEEDKCLSEIRRVLKDNGVAIVNIPYNPSQDDTLEDNNIITEEDRERFYGQMDHVRLYGRNTSFVFEKNGFIVNQIKTEIFSKNFIEYYKLKSDDCGSIDTGGYFILRKRI